MMSRFDSGLITVDTTIEPMTYHFFNSLIGSDFKTLEGPKNKEKYYRKISQKTQNQTERTQESRGFAALALSLESDPSLNNTDQELEVRERRRCRV